MSKTIRIRVTDRMDEMLSELSMLSGLSKTEYIRSIIREKYEAVEEKKNDQ